jgi:hypothetical protein
MAHYPTHKEKAGRALRAYMDLLDTAEWIKGELRGPLMSFDLAMGDSAARLKPPTAATLLCPREQLLADDFGVGAGGDDADDARAVEVDVDFEVFGFRAELVELFAVDVLAAERFDGDRAGRVLLRDED